MVFGFGGNPNAVVIQVLSFVAQREYNFVSNVNSMTAEHRLDAGLKREELLQYKIKWDGI